MASLSAEKEGLDFSFPDWKLESVLDLARLPPAEPGSNEAMRLLCVLTRGHWANCNLGFPGVSIEQASLCTDSPGASNATVMEDARDDSEPPGSVIGGELARAGAATVALAHLKSAKHPDAGGVGKPWQITRGVFARFVTWICKVAPEVFPDLQERGLLEVLVDILRSSARAERPDLGITVAGLAIQFDEARIPLQALGAITALGETLKVCPALLTHAATKYW